MDPRLNSDKWIAIENKEAVLMLWHDRNLFGYVVTTLKWSEWEAISFVEDIKIDKRELTELWRGGNHIEALDTFIAPLETIEAADRCYGYLENTGHGPFAIFLCSQVLSRGLFYRDDSEIKGVFLH